MLKRTINLVFIFLLLFGLPGLVISQPTWTVDLFGKEKKPEKFENRKLGSEKTADKKFTVPRNFYQNNVTHYNYYFNANNRVNTVVDRAKLSYKDDYSGLLAFYPYTLENTSSQKSELDSVIYTSTAGILLHDLRNDWIDNMYMLIGKAYFFKGELDSAMMTFQFINYNLFPRKRKNDDDDRIVGTTSSASGSSISIANKEKRNILQKTFALPPSRNDALIWLSRTLIEQDEFGESGGLINTLQNDQNLPKRLYNDLEEVNSYWFYKQGNFDSAAVHLEKALSNADTKQDRARWEFLLAQLYEMSGNYDKASDHYTRASKHTVDPLLDIYARLNEAKMLKATNSKELDRSIDNLLKMAKRDKFESFRDIIYYSAGQLALQKPDTNAAIIYFNKSLKRNESNINYKNRAYLQLGDIAYSRKQYRLAASMYDSLQNGPDTILNKKIEQIQSRKNALSKIAEAITNIEREDSLQRVALMAPVERDDLIRKLVRKLRREKGLKDDGNSGAGGEIIPFGNNPAPVDLFAGNTRGEWYFYNSSMKSRGFSEFKTKWGNRANGDNWRRKSAVPDNIATNPPGTTLDAKGNVVPVSTNTGNTQTADISYDALITNVPLTEEKLSASNEIIATNMLELAKLYQNELEEYGLAAATYEDYLTRFPSRLQDGEVYLGLYYCYIKLGNKEKADYYKGLLDRRFANSKSAQVLNNPSSLNPKTKNPEATKLYEDIYNLFIEGDFEKAIREKRKADSIYGVNYWTPQLLYIEALNHVKNRNDSSAILGLQTLMNSYPSSPLKDKAATMIDVLRRRAEIETYLTSLEVTRAGEDTLAKINDKPVVVNPPVVRAPVIADSTKKPAPPPLTSGPFVMSLTSAHHVIMILDKVDAVYVNEARNAFNRYNKENFYGQPIQINKDVLDAERSLLVITSFADAAAALQYYDKIKRSAASEISWLPANKYSFMIITDENLQLLKTNKNIPGYKALLNTQYPNRF